jgi:hypothetical protein
MKEKLMGLIRHGLTFLGGLVVAKGYIDESSVMEIVGALMTLIGSIWSVAQKK